MSETPLTDEEKAQVRAEYEEIKNVMMDIDAKYSLSYNKIEMDFPESLGLTKLQFVQHTDAELEALAEQQIEEKYLGKSAAASSSYNISLMHLEAALRTLAEKHRHALFRLDEEYQKNLSELMRKLTNHGVLYSSATAQKTSEAIADYERKVADASESFNNQKTSVETKIDDLTENYQAKCTSLQAERAAAKAQAMEVLRQKDEKARIAVEKYNQNVDERENRYQASCVRALQYAKQAEYERAINASRLYAELGAAGVEQQMMSEKLLYCKMTFNTMNQRQARYMLSLDNFLQSHLREYYTNLVEWIDTLLP